MRINKGFVLREVGDEKVIVGEGLEAVNFGRLLVLNESAVWLWEQAQAMGDFNVELLANRLCDRYDVTMDEVLKDVTEMIDEWKNIGVVEE